MGCGVSAVRAWDDGRNRVPWSAVRLLRIYRQGELPADAWAGWHVWEDRLIAPDAFVYALADLSLWSLTCWQAECWRKYRERRREN